MTVAWWEQPSCRCGWISPEETQEAPQAPVSNFSADLMKRKQAFTLSPELQMNKPILRKAMSVDSEGVPIACRVP